MQNFDLNKQKATLKQESTVPPGPTILSATTASSSIPSELNYLSATRCSIKLCTETVRRTPTVFRATPRPATSTHSSFSVQPQLKSPEHSQPLKKAQAVLVAANVDYNVTQSNLPKYVTDRLNKYIMSENYSLGATTSSVPASSPFVAATPTTKSWHPDSASTVSITDNIEDLHGSARFDHRLQVFFVPLFAVKLLSLGTLSKLGYSSASGPDRWLTITTSFGRSLCHCPIQPNNTWIFPSSLISPKTSVHTGNSVISSAAVSRQTLSRPSSAV